MRDFSRRAMALASRVRGSVGRANFGPKLGRVGAVARRIRLGIGFFLRFLGFFGPKGPSLGGLAKFRLKRARPRGRRGSCVPHGVWCSSCRGPTSPGASCFGGSLKVPHLFCEKTWHYPFFWEVIAKFFGGFSFLTQNHQKLTIFRVFGEIVREGPVLLGKICYFCPALELSSLFRKIEKFLKIFDFFEKGT